MKYTYMMIPGLTPTAKAELDGVYSVEKYERVINAVAEVTGIKYEVMKQKSRIRDIVESRNIAMFCIKDIYPNISLSAIGKLFGKDHTTVIHSLRSVREWNDSDWKFRTKYEKSHRNVFLTCT